jgi:hypothetical protein
MTPNAETTDPLLYIQEAIAAWLQSQSYFADLPIFLADQGNVLENLKINLAKLGLAIVIEPTTPTFGYSGTVIQMDTPVAITVWETVLTNRGATGSRKRASEVVIQIVRAFKPQTPAAPCVIVDAQLKRDSAGECVYTLTAKKKFAL